MISLTAEYALRAVVYMATAQSGPLVASDIATATHIPSGYIRTVLRTLSNAGILLAQRGSGGGFTLARPAGEITVLDVVRAAECPPRREEDVRDATRKLLERAAGGMERLFLHTTIEDLALKQRSAPPGERLADPK